MPGECSAITLTAWPRSKICWEKRILNSILPCALAILIIYDPIEHATLIFELTQIINHHKIYCTANFQNSEASYLFQHKIRLQIHMGTVYILCFICTYINAG